MQRSHPRPSGRDLESTMTAIFRKLRAPLFLVFLASGLAMPAFPADGPTVAPPAGGVPAPQDKGTKSQRKAIAALPQKYRDWLDYVDLLITKPEKKAFLALDQDYQRDAFIERFWEVRDGNGTPGEFRRNWEARVEQVTTQFGSVKDDRARVFLLNGPPGGVVAEHCATVIWPIEAWYYQRSERLGSEFVVVFYQHWGAGPWRIWEPAQGLGELFMDENPSNGLGQIVNGCRNGDSIAGAISWVSNQGLGYMGLETTFLSNAKGPGHEWISSFHSYSTDLAANTAALPAKLATSYPGRHGERTLMQALVSVPASAATSATSSSFRATSRRPPICRSSSSARCGPATTRSSSSLRISTRTRPPASSRN
jgi:GWxTD domain-containing protein